MPVRPFEIVRRFLRADDGASTVEFTLVVIPFIALILACLQLALVFLLGQAIQTATVKSARYLITGQGLLLTQSTFKTNVCNNLPSVFDCSKLLVDVQSQGQFSLISTTPIPITYDKNGNVTNNFAYTPGGKGDIVIVRAMYDWPIFGGGGSMFNGFGLSNQPDGGFLMIGTAVGKNEPY